MINQNNAGFMNSIPMVTRNIIIINVLIWLADSLLSKDGTMVNLFGLHYFTSEYFKPHQIITCMFMHGGFSHILFNMFAVFMFGRTLETVWGPKKFLFYYMVTGIGASLLQLLIMYIRVHSLEVDIPLEVINQIKTEGLSILMSGKNYSDSTMGDLNLLYNGVMVGASGAVFGILVAFGMLFPDVKLFIIPFPFPIKAKWFVMGYGAIELWQGVANNIGDNVAHFAHLGGLITGFFIILYWRKKAKIKSNNGHIY